MDDIKTFQAWASNVWDISDTFILWWHKQIEDYKCKKSIDYFQTEVSIHLDQISKLIWKVKIFFYWMRSTFTYWQGAYRTYSLNKSHITVLMVYKQPTTLRNAGYQIFYAPLSINNNAHRGSVMPIIYTWKFLDFLFRTNISANKSNRFFLVTYCNIVLLIFMKYIHEL